MKQKNTINLQVVLVYRREIKRIISPGHEHQQDVLCVPEVKRLNWPSWNNCCLLGCPWCRLEEERPSSWSLELWESQRRKKTSQLKKMEFRNQCESVRSSNRWVSRLLQQLVCVTPLGSTSKFSRRNSAPTDGRGEEKRPASESAMETCGLLQDGKTSTYLLKYIINISQISF